MKRIVAILLLICLLIVPMSQYVVAIKVEYIGYREIMEDIYDNKNAWYYDAALFVENSGLYLAYEYHIAYFGPNESATRLELINMIAYYNWIHVRSSDVTEKQKICTAFSVCMCLRRPSALTVCPIHRPTGKPRSTSFRPEHPLQRVIWKR